PQQGGFPAWWRRRSRPQKVALIAAGGVWALIVLGVIVGEEDTGRPVADSKPAPAAEKEDKSEEKAKEPVEEKPDPEPESEPAVADEQQEGDVVAFDPLPGADTNAWVSAMTGHGVTWQKAGIEEDPLEGFPDRLGWFGVMKEGQGFSDPETIASAVADTDTRLVEINCHAAGIPTIGPTDKQVRMFVACVTAADIDDVDPAAAADWISGNYRGLYGGEGFQRESATFGPIRLDITVVANTAMLGVRPADE
ncbi:hypothetical protein, partial [Streptomyces alkaliphilus]|uniref:hypothetical protein n=1 Tax=Streptomyces alkaliphilus TaxID=1472722 RepID=UPI001E30230F